MKLFKTKWFKRKKKRYNARLLFFFFFFGLHGENFSRYIDENEAK